MSAADVTVATMDTSVILNSAELEVPSLRETVAASP